MSALAKGLNSQDRFVLIVDDYEKIHDKEIQRFFTQLVEVNLENLCIIIISGIRTDLGILCLSNGGTVYDITMEELRFTPEETQDLLILNNINTEYSSEQIEEATNGWPLAINLFIKHHHTGNNQEFVSKTRRLFAEKLFEEYFFSKYSKGIRLLLIKLSLVKEFSLDLVKKLYKGDIEKTAQILQSNLFITFDSNRKLFEFNKLYLEFLNSKLYLLQDMEIDQLYYKAAKFFYENNMVKEAIRFFGLCENYDEMLKVMYEIPINSVSLKTAKFLLDHIAILPKDYIDNNPLAEYYASNIHINNMNIESAENALGNLELRLIECENNSNIETLGEVYISLAAIKMLQNKEGFLEYYIKAFKCLPNGSVFKSRDMMFVGNNDVFFLPDNASGSSERMEKAWFEAMPYMEKLMNGGARGLASLFSAELAFYRCNFSKAEEQAYRAIYMAKEHSQHDIVLNAHFLLMRIAVMHGNYKNLMDNMAYITEYISPERPLYLETIRDSAKAWLCVSMNDLESFPLQFKANSPKIADGAPIDFGRDKLLYASFLLKSESYYELTAYLSWLEEKYLKRGYWASRLSVLIMEAIGYYKIGDKSKAINAFWRAYEMSYQNNIISPFIEEGNNMRSLVNAARNQTHYLFDEGWLTTISKKASTYAKKLSALASNYDRNGSSQSKQELGITSKELKLLLCLSQGLTREEIAEQNFLSLNTVKTRIASIYSKLGAANKADAIRISMSLNIIS